MSYINKNYKQHKKLSDANIIISTDPNTGLKYSYNKQTMETKWLTSDEKNDSPNHQIHLEIGDNDDDDSNLINNNPPKYTRLKKAIKYLIFICLNISFIYSFVWMQTTGDKVSFGDIPILTSNYGTNYVNARCRIKNRCSIENPTRTYNANATTKEYNGYNPYSNTTTLPYEYLPGRDCLFDSTIITKINTKDGKLPPSYQDGHVGLSTQSLFAPSVLCNKDLWPAKATTWRGLPAQLTQMINAVVAQNPTPYSSGNDIDADGIYKRYIKHGCNLNTSFTKPYLTQLMSTEPIQRPTTRTNVETAWTRTKPWTQINSDGTVNGFPTKRGGYGEGCPCLWDKSDKDKNQNGIEINCVIHSPSVFEQMENNMISDYVDINILEYEMLTIVPYHVSTNNFNLRWACMGGEDCTGQPYRPVIETVVTFCLILLSPMYICLICFPLGFCLLWLLNGYRPTFDF